MRLDDFSRLYGGSWDEVSRESITECEDFSDIASAEVTEHDFRQDDGSIKTRVSICLTMKNKRVRYLVLSKDSELEVGDPVDPSTIDIIELERDGETIHRADGEVLKKTSKTSKTSKKGKK